MSEKEIYRETNVTIESPLLDDEVQEAMKDIYLYEGSNVLKNLLNIKKQAELDEAEADYVSFRLKDIAKNIKNKLYLS